MLVARVWVTSERFRNNGRGESRALPGSAPSLLPRPSPPRPPPSPLMLTTVGVVFDVVTLDQLLHAEYGLAWPVAELQDGALKEVHLTREVRQEGEGCSAGYGAGRGLPP